jgi:hypothetical protein
MPIPDPNSPSPMPSPGGPQGPAGAAQPGQPPIGSSPATQPVPNRGLEAAGVAKLGVAVRLLEQIVPLLGAGSEAGRDVLQALTKLSKHVQSGSNSSVEQQALAEQMMKARQMGPQIAAMRAAQPSMPGGPTPPPNIAAMLAARPQGTA